MDTTRNAARAAPGTGTARHNQPPAKVADPRSHANLARPAQVALTADALAAVAELLAALPDPAVEVEFWRQLAREAARDAWRAGYQAGYERAEADMARRWREIAEPVARGGITYGEIESRRWGPGGRERFGDPRPGDRFPWKRQETAA